MKKILALVLLSVFALSPRVAHAATYSCIAKNATLDSASITVMPSDGTLQGLSVSLYTTDGTQYPPSSVSPVQAPAPSTTMGATYSFTGLAQGTVYYPIISGTGMQPQQVADCMVTTALGPTQPATTPTTLPSSNNPFQVGGVISSTTTPSSVTPQGTTPVVAAPQANASQLKQCSSIKFDSILDILIWLKCIIVIAIIPLIFAGALLFFLWGVMKFVMASDSSKKEEGKKFIISGLIGLFVMTSLWGIIAIAGNILGTSGSTVPLLQTECLTKNGCKPKTP